jgi:hypothetical protein
MMPDEPKIHIITIHQTNDYSSLQSPDFRTEAYTDEQIAKDRLDELTTGLESHSGVFYMLETISINKRNN